MPQNPFSNGESGRGRVPAALLTGGLVLALTPTLPECELNSIHLQFLLSARSPLRTVHQLGRLQTAETVHRLGQGVPVRVRGLDFFGGCRMCFAINEKAQSGFPTSGRCEDSRKLGVYNYADFATNSSVLSIPSACNLLAAAYAEPCLFLKRPAWRVVGSTPAALQHRRKYSLVLAYSALVINGGVLLTFLLPSPLGERVAAASTSRD